MFSILFLTLLAQATPPADFPAPPGPLSTNPDAQAPDDEASAGEVPAASGDESFGPAGPAAYTLRTLIQTRFQQSWVSLDPGLVNRLASEVDPMRLEGELAVLKAMTRAEDGLRLNRAFLRATAQPTPYLSVKVLIDVAEFLEHSPEKVLKLAFGDITPWDWLSLRVGLFKRPFSLLELIPAARFEFAEEGPTGSLAKTLRLSGRDVGVMVDVTPLRKRRWLHVVAGVFQGEALGAQTFRAPGVLSGRITSRLLKRIRLGADMVWRPRATADWWDYYRFQYDAQTSGHAVSTDITAKLAHLEVRAEWQRGDRTDVDVDVPFLQRRGDARTYTAVWGLATYSVELRSWRLLPAIRVEWLDVDREHAAGVIRYLSAALNVDFSDRVRLLLDLSRFDAQPGTRRWDLPFVRYYANSTTIVTQLQLKI